MINIQKIRQKKKEAQQQRGKTFENTVRYTLIKNSRKEVIDIRLGFGSFMGRRIREMVNDPNAVNYIRNFLLNKESGFPKKFQDLVRTAFDKYYDDFLEDDIAY